MNVNMQTVFLKKTSCEVKANLHLTRNQVLFYLFFLSYLAPVGINFGGMHYLLSLLKYALCGWFFLSMGIDKLLKRKMVPVFLLYYFIITISTVVSGGKLVDAATYFVSSVIFVLVFIHYSCKRDILFFGALKNYVIILLIVNVAVRIMGLATGKQDLVFIAIENHQGFFYIFALFLWAMYTFVYRNPGVMLLFLVVLNVALYSGDTMKILLCFFLLYLVYNEIRTRPRISSLLVFMVAVLIFVGIVFLSVQKAFRVTEGITFTGRTFLWEYALKIFHSRPVSVLGYGTTLVSFVPASVITSWSTYYLGTHNDILYRLIMGGPFAFLIFFGLLFFVAFHLQKKKGKTQEVFSILIFIMFIHHMLENVEYELFFPMLIIIYYGYIKKRPEKALRNKRGTENG